MDELRGSHDVTVGPWIARWLRRGGGYVRSVRGAHATLVAIAVAASMLALPVAASAVFPADGPSVDAPGLTAGPFITDAGLAWESSDGVMLTNSAGSSTVLAPPDAPSWNGLIDLAWFGRDWWGLARPSGVFAGRIGGPLRALPLLRKCNPGSVSRTPGVEASQYAVSGEHLYAVLPKGCLPRRAAPFGEVVGINLRSRRWRVLAPMPGALDYVAASGKYLALAYWRTPSHIGAESRLLVRVLDSATGTLVNQIAPPRHAGGLGPNNPAGIQVDDKGDVLVTTGCCGASPGQLAHLAQPLERTGWWWARAGSTIGQATHLGSDAVLSDGRAAFFSLDAGNPGGMTIDIKNLLASTTRTVVVFSGSMSAESLALNGNQFVWAQQSIVVNVVRGPVAGGGSFEECKDVPLSPLELARLNLRDIPSPPVVVSGAPIPPQYANEPPCIRKSPRQLRSTAS